MVLNIFVSPTILDAPYTWLTFLGVLGIRVLNGTSKTFRYTPALSLPLALCGVLNRP